MINLRAEKEIIKTWKKYKKSIIRINCITYNQEDYIKDALNSFLSQYTEYPFEILIHDDASTALTKRKVYHPITQILYNEIW